MGSEAIVLLRHEYLQYQSKSVVAEKSAQYVPRVASVGAPPV